MPSRDQLIFEVQVVPSEASIRNLSSRVSREVGASSNLKKEIDATADEVRLLTKDLENLGARGERSAEELEQAYAELQARLDKVDGVTKKTVSAQSTLIGAQNRLAGSTGNYQQLQSNANQALFSFGDIANDAQQFQFGLGQGFRAIGNNIGFLSEQTANLSTKAGGFTGALKALGGSLLGPGGIILGIQLAVTAITVFGDKLFGAEKKTENLNEDLKSTSSFLDQISQSATSDFLQPIEDIDFQIENIDKAVQALTQSFGGVNFREDFQLPLDQARSDATNIVGQFDNLDSVLGKVNNELSDADILEKQALQSVKDVLLNKRAELEAQKLINEAIRESQLLRQGDIELPEFSLDEDVLVDDDALNKALESQRANVGVDLGIREGTIASGLKELERLNTSFQNAVTDEERMAIAKRIDLKEKEIAAKKGLAENEKEFTISTLADIAQVSSQIIKGIFGENKAVQIATAIADGIVAVQKALASAPPPLNYALAAGVGVATLKNVQRIKETEIGSSSPASFSAPNVQAPTRNFVSREGNVVPPRSDLQSKATFIIEQKVKNKELAILVREGNDEIRTQQVSVN